MSPLASMVASTQFYAVCCAGPVLQARLVFSILFAVQESDDFLAVLSAKLEVALLLNGLL